MGKGCNNIMTCVKNVHLSKYVKQEDDETMDVMWILATCCNIVILKKSNEENDSLMPVLWPI